MQPRRRAFSRTVFRRKLLELVMQCDAMDELPGMLPALASHEQGNLLEDATGVAELAQPVGVGGANLLGRNPPTPEQTVGVGRHVHGGADLVSKTRLLIQLLCETDSSQSTGTLRLSERLLVAPAYIDLVTSTAEAYGGAEAADACADNGDSQGLVMLVKQRG